MSKDRRPRRPEGRQDELVSPYNFALLSEHIVDDWEEPAPGGLPSHDHPYEDGMSGEIRFTLEADGPILVAGAPETEGRRTVRKFFLGPDDRPAIPGSSLRGMIRSVIEIAGFGRFRLVEDRKFSLRDVSGAVPEYTARLTRNLGNDPKGPFASRAVAGWLREGSKGWTFQECEFSRIEHDDIAQLPDAPAKFRNRVETLKRAKASDRTAGPDPKSAPAVYDIWDVADKTFDIWVEPENDHPHSKGKKLRYSRAYPDRANAACTVTRGELVFTGQPSKMKHLEFFFHSPATVAEELPEKVVRGFLDVHERQEKPNPSWEWWKKRLRGGEVQKIPAFVVKRDDGSIEALGFAMMFKLAQRNSVHDVVRNLNAAHLHEDDAPDLAERIFGRVADSEGHSFKGRVRFSLAKVLGTKGTEWRESEPMDTVLSNPKPSWFPAYLWHGELDPSQGRLLRGKRKYRTWMTQDARLRGWKRYPVRNPQEIEVRPPQPPRNVSEDSKAWLCPLYAGSGGTPPRFEGSVQFHNLRPWEVGALVWALEWGCDSKSRLRRHSIGMGKPFGWGQLHFQLSEARIRRNLPATEGGDGIEEGAGALQRLRDEVANFTREMEEKLKGKGGWSGSPTLVSLLETATPQTGSPHHSLRYPVMQMDGPHQRDEFREAKDLALVLKPWGIPAPRFRDPPDPFASGADGSASRQGEARRSGQRTQAPMPAAATAEVLYRRGDVLMHEDYHEELELLEDANEGGSVRVRGRETGREFEVDADGLFKDE